jgi:S-methylmethionine-dependent homocysteine/selenocysteine methylase
MPFRTPSTEPGSITLTDGGLETDLIFHAGIDLPMFASFPLLDSVEGRAALTDYYTRAIATAEAAGLPFSLDTATWRANPDWAARLGYSGDDTDRLNREAALFAIGLRDAAREAGASIPILVCGVLGPRDDGYAPGAEMSAEEARAYHRRELEVLAAAGVDYASAMTITTIGEAIGVVLAAVEVGVPIVVFFTVETDGRLPTGDSLRDAVEAVDAATDGAAAYFGVNCAHPEHLPEDLDRPWASRVAAFRANASRRTHAELDEAEDLDDGDPDELAAGFADLRARVPALTVFGGCCGTDDRHLRAISRALVAG